MALNTEERKKALSDLIANQKPISTRKISFAGENKDRDVYRIPIEYLVLNVANGRINSDVDSWEVQNGNIDIENPEHEKMVESWIWEKHPEENEKTYKDLDQNGQKEPGQVTSDGIIVGGNRRATILRRLGKTTFDAVIMDSDSSNPLDILRLEKTLQHGVDAQVDYGPIEKYLEASVVVDRLGGRELVEGSNDKFKQVIEMLPRYKTLKQLTDALDVKQSMEDYLDHVGASGYFKALDQKENYLIEYTDSSKSYKPDNKAWADRKLTRREISDWREMVFDFTRIQVKEDFRLLSQKDQEGSGHILGNKAAFEKTLEMYKQEIQPEIRKLKTLDDFRHDNPNNAEENWHNQERSLKENLEGKCKGALGKGKREIELTKLEKTPEEYLKRASRTLQKMSDLIDEDEIEVNEALIDLANECRRISAHIYTSLK